MRTPLADDETDGPAARPPCSPRAPALAERRVHSSRRPAWRAVVRQTDVRSIRYDRRMLDFPPEAPGEAVVGTAVSAPEELDEGAEGGQAGGTLVELDESADPRTAGGAPAQLDEAQRRAVEHGEGPCLVLAGPGSGKTRVIVERFLRLIGEGTSPDRLLVLTYTRKAADEMRDRVERIHGPFEGEPPLTNYHSFAQRVVRRWGWRLGIS